ncbi:hypothetical protein ACFSC4_23545 [Deinococcus malanensis]|uniref:hypothetical protein n=1 Tax=Deinococcus malanensis TaxID=1706855 RepID=UPI003638D287
MAFLTHADTDLLNLRAAQETLPDDFGPVTGVPLGGVRSEAQMATLLSGEVGRAQVVLVRIHGKFSAVPGAELLLAHARKAGQALLLVSGTGEPDAELAALSLAPAHTLDTARTYLAASGWQNTRELLVSLSDTLRLTAYGAAPPWPSRNTASITRSCPKTPRWRTGISAATRPGRRLACCSTALTP